MCNQELTTFTDDDMFDVEIVVKVKDIPEILEQPTTNLTFGIGVTYSTTQIWVSSLDFSVRKAVKFHCVVLQYYIISIGFEGI